MAGLPNFERSALPHMDAAFNLAYWLLRSRPDAEDVVQEAYLRAFRAYASMTGDDIRPWLLTIVRNCAYKALAKRQRGGNVISFDEAYPARAGEAAGANIASDTATPEEHLLGDGQRTLVLAALAELRPAFREVVVLREMEELSYREIADITGTPIGTVMSRLSRARIELKSILTRLIDKDENNAV